MFLLIVLFGLSALGLALALYIQADIPQKPLPPAAPAAISQPAAAAAPEPAATTAPEGGEPAADPLPPAGTTADTDAMKP